MPKTRSEVSKDAAAREGDSDTNDDFEETVIRQPPASSLAHQSLEMRLTEILQQVQNLQEEIRQNRLVQANTVATDEIIATAFSVIGRSQASSQPAPTRKLYDLPEFDGRPEDWPMFKETFLMTTEVYQYSDTQNMMSH
ncbi:PREDICTED: uncharacterized protein LOC108372067 [Rhagoletis zephyria]|uniref:uncharacterized protein LOC108372067 n=1 Tax=Rhagoletis zephyria TaxID=28612 RepID=UPI0008112D97|nr:PREDICTED: uncharacterized protein LOC108372067 [Rhagoletis zephyria]